MHRENVANFTVSEMRTGVGLGGTRQSLTSLHPLPSIREAGRVDVRLDPAVAVTVTCGTSRARLGAASRCCPAGVRAGELGNAPQAPRAPSHTSSLPHAAPSFLLFYLLLAGEFLQDPV